MLSRLKHQVAFLHTPLIVFFHTPLAKDIIRLIFQLVVYKLNIKHVMAHVLLSCIPKILKTWILEI